jgi:hypothetical protein
MSSEPFIDLALERIFVLQPYTSFLPVILTIGFMIFLTLGGKRKNLLNR